MTGIFLFLEKWFVPLFYWIQIVPVLFLISYLELKHPYYTNLPYLLGLLGIIFIPGKSWQNHRILAWLPMIFYFGIISLLSAATLKTSGKIAGNVFHPIEYAALSAIAAYCMQRALIIPTAKQFAIIIFVGTVLGFLDEFHQYFVPGRTADIVDLLLDTAGLVVGLTLFSTLAFIKQKFSKA
jgi:hypothetical protein